MHVVIFIEKFKTYLHYFVGSRDPSGSVLQDCAFVMYGSRDKITFDIETVCKLFSSSFIC